MMFRLGRDIIDHVDLNIKSFMYIETFRRRWMSFQTEYFSFFSKITNQISDCSNLDQIFICRKKKNE